MATQMSKQHLKMRKAFSIMVLKECVLIFVYIFFILHFYVTYFGTPYLWCLVIAVILLECHVRKLFEIRSASI
jgi:uncharacterized membrane protein